MTVKNNKTVTEGPIWVFANGTVWSVKPTLDGAEIQKLRENYYWSKIRNNYSTLIYAKKYTLEVLDPKQNQDETLTSEVITMTEAPDVDLWNKSAMIFPDWFDWGCNPVNDAWDYVGRRWTLLKLNRIPPELLTKKPPESQYVWNEILQGIVANDAGEIQVWMTDQRTGELTLLKNVTLIKDPTVPEMAGVPMAHPIIQPIRMMNYAWEAQMQCVGRDGAPSAVIEMTKWTQDDIDYAQKVLNNMSKDAQFQLRPGMKLIPLAFPTPVTAAATIAMLKEMILDCHNPSKLISREGGTIGGDTSSELELVYEFIAGIHRKMEQALERLLQPYLDENGYVGYKVRVHIPSPSVDKSELHLKQADLLLKSGTGSPHEIRALCDADVVSDEEVISYAEHWREYPPTGGAVSTDPFGVTLANKAGTSQQQSAAEAVHLRVASATFNNLDAALKRLEKRVIAEEGE